MKEINKYWKNSAAKFVATLGIILALGVTAFAQAGAIVSGTITQDGSAIVTDATVTLVSQADKKISFTAQTDANGNYRFENVPAGKYTLTAAAAGTRQIGVYSRLRLRLQRAKARSST